MFHQHPKLALVCCVYCVVCIVIREIDYNDIHSVLVSSHVAVFFSTPTTQHCVSLCTFLHIAQLYWDCIIMYHTHHTYASLSLFTRKVSYIYTITPWLENSFFSCLWYICYLAMTWNLNKNLTVLIYNKHCCTC